MRQIKKLLSFLTSIINVSRGCGGECRVKGTKRKVTKKRVTKKKVKVVGVPVTPVYKGK